MSDAAITSIDQLLTQMVQLNASDLHITVGSPPVVRLRGHLQRFDGVPSLSADETRDLLYRILSSEQQKRLEINRQLDLAHSIPGVARFRVNVFFQRETLGAAFRLIPNEIKSLEELGLSASLHQLAEKPRGLVLVTGPTGSGKSTTLASVIDEINRTRHDHILTIEDPIEFLHRHKGCIVNQREIGVDATSFAEGLRGALRQDPDVILVGEMRDLETIATAMTAAETGHLVFGTLHTQSAPGNDRPHHRRLPARAAGAGARADRRHAPGRRHPGAAADRRRQGRVPALEILLPDDAVRNLIRQGKVEQIYSVMQTGTAKGMADDGAVARRADPARRDHEGAGPVALVAARAARGPARARRLRHGRGRRERDERPSACACGARPRLQRAARHRELVVSGSIWKKEFSLRKKDEETAAEEAHVAAPTEPVAAEPAAEQAVDQASVAPLPEVTGDYGWLTANFDPNEVPENMPTVSAPQVPVASAAAAPVEAPTAPDLPSVVAPAVVVPTPEPVAEQPESSPADSTDAKTPFWKKELSVKRAPKEAKAAKEPKAAKAPKETKVKAEKQPKQPKEPKEQQPPFWKREVSFGKSKDKAVAEQAPQEAGSRQRSSRRRSSRRSGSARSRSARARTQPASRPSRRRRPSASRARRRARSRRLPPRVRAGSSG